MNCCNDKIHYIVFFYFMVYYLKIYDDEDGFSLIFVLAGISYEILCKY